MKITCIQSAIENNCSHYKPTFLFFKEKTNPTYNRENI